MNICSLQNLKQVQYATSRNSDLFVLDWQLLSRQSFTFKLTSPALGWQLGRNCTRPNSQFSRGLRELCDMSNVHVFLAW
jgi:hypothetical protein